jgi:hypothetical protein
VQVVATKPWRIEDRLRQDHAIGNHDGCIRLMRTELFQRFRRLQGLRRQHGNAEPSCLLFNRRRLQLQAAPPARLRRAGIDGRDLVAVGDELQQRRHGEIGRTHEDQAERHW